MNTRMLSQTLVGGTWTDRFQLGRQALLLALLWLVVGMFNTAQAEDPDPSSRVARISYIKGRVFMQPAAADAWTEARINRPLTSGDQLWTEAYSRSELQIGHASLQVDANTQLRLLELSDAVLQIEVTQGVINLHLRNLERGATVEVDTPNAAISALDSGTYRIEVAPDRDHTVVQVRDGSVEAAGERQSFNLREGEQLTLQGANRLSAAYEDVPRMDEFDRWSEDRNLRAGRVTSSRYVSSDVIGYEDLDDYGYWRWYQSYGYVWQPSRIVSGWAPYRYGQWTWISPWGWTWVDDAPWGFAPFHYGRWTQISNRWCWVPGPRTARAMYAPALVAWVGTPGLNLSVNIGNQPVGWIPLGPREVYRPYYPSSVTYVFNINVNNSPLDRNEFDRGYRRKPHEENYGNRNAMSVVTAGVLTGAQPVNNHLVRGNDSRLQAIASAPVTRPEATSILGGERRTTPRQVNTREVLARRQPAIPVADTRATGNNGKSTDVTVPSPRGSVRETNVRSNVRVISPSPSRRTDSNGNGPNLDNRAIGGASTTRDNTRDNNTAAPRSRDNAPRLETGGTSDNRSSTVDTQPARAERSPVNTPYIRPSTMDDRMGADNRTVIQPSDNSRENSRGVSSNSTNPGTNDSGVNELRTRNNSWIRDEAPGRSRTETRSQNPRLPETGAPAAVTPRSEPMPNREPRATATPQNSPRSMQPTTSSSTPTAETRETPVRTPRGDQKIDDRFDIR